MDMSAIQLVFANGVETPLFEAEDAPNETLQVIDIDQTREIRYVRMKLYYGIYYTGLWLIDDTGETIVKDVWFDVGSDLDIWMPQQEIPIGQHIIGLKCDTLGHEHGINHLSFLLGNQDHVCVVGDLRFPAMEVYPTYLQY